MEIHNIFIRILSWFPTMEMWTGIREDTNKPGQVHPWLGHQRPQLGDDKLAGKPICTTRVARRVEHRDVRHEIQRLKDDVRDPIAVRRLQ
jgi:hypothetical protein